MADDDSIDPGSGRILGAGSNNLQRSIDSLAQSVQRNTEAVNRLSQPGPGRSRTRTTSTSAGDPGSKSTGPASAGGAGSQRARTTTVSPPATSVPGYSSPPSIYQRLGYNSPDGGSSGGGGYRWGPKGPSSPGQLKVTPYNPIPTLSKGFQALGKLGNTMLPTATALDTYAQWQGINQGSPTGADGTSGSTVNNLRKQVFGSQGRNLTGWANDAKDAVAAAFLASRASGYNVLQAGSMAPNSQFSSYLGNIKDLSLLNPTLGGANAAQTFNSLASTRALYSSWAFGYKPILGLGGTVNRGALGSFTDSVMQRTFQGRTNVSAKELQAALGQNGSLNANISAYVNSVGGGQQMTQALEDYIRGRNTASLHGISGSQFDSLLNKAESGGSGADAARSKLKSIGIDNTILQSQRDLKSSQTQNVNDLLDQFGPAVKNATGALQDLYQVINTITNLPGIKNIVGTGAGWGSVFGGLLGNGVSGALGGLAMGAFGGSLGGGGGGGLLGGAGVLGSAARIAGPVGLGLIGGAAINSVGHAATSHIKNDDVRGGANFLVDAGTGAAVGAGIGSVVPGVGTAVGAGVGAVVGGAWGLYKNWDASDAKIKYKGMSRIMPSDGVNGGATQPSGSTSGSSSSSGTSGSSASGSVVAGKTAAGAIATAISEIGKPYEWGGTGPNSFDCSGLMQFSYHSIGVNLPRTSQQQMKAGEHVDLSDVRPGDLMFPYPGHVVMSLGNGNIIEAPRPGQDVRIMPQSEYGSYQEIRRIVGSVGSLSGINTPNTPQQQQAGRSGGDSGAQGLGDMYGSTEEVDAFNVAIANVGSTLNTLPMGDSASNPSANVPSAPSSVSGNVALGKRLAAQAGWTGKEWDALYQLWMGESGWRSNVKNPNSTAYGIPQALVGGANGHDMSKEYGGKYKDYTTNPASQIGWGIQYIKSVYGDPINAYQKWSARKPHWYDTGAWDIPQDQLAMVHKGEMIIERPKAETIRAALLRDIPQSKEPGSLNSSSAGGTSSGGVTLVFQQGAVSFSSSSSLSSVDVRNFASSFADNLAQDRRIKNLARGL